MSNAISGVGTTLYKYDNVDKRYVKINEITGIDGPALTREVINITSLDSQDGYMEFKSGKRSSGALSLSMNFSRAMYDLFKADFESEDYVLYKLVFPDTDSTTFLFSGMVDKLPLTIPMDDKINMDISIQVNGRVTVTPSSFVPEEDAIFVSTTGSDLNSGTFTAPYATVNKALSVVGVGKAIYVRGGTYNMSINAYSTAYGSYINGKVGTAYSRYKLFGYPGEKVIFDYSGISYAGVRYGIAFANCTYWHIKNIEFTNVLQYTTAIVRPFSLSSCSYMRMEACSFHHNEGAGTHLTGAYNEIEFLNCDGYDNYDANTLGENADGFAIANNTNPSGITRFIGCRAWNNADDGYDCWRNNGLVIFENCWAWHNGYVHNTNTPAGNGNGFKLGETASGLDFHTTTLRILKNCVSANNRQYGVNQNNCNGILEIYNISVYNNTGHGFWFFPYNNAHIIRNCISYNNGSDIFLSNTVHDHNSWDSGVTVNSADFVSLDGSELENERDSDFNLPEVSFLHLNSGSDLVNAGIDVGLPFRGSTPDIGAFEY